LGFKFNDNKAFVLFSMEFQPLVSCLALRRHSIILAKESFIHSMHRFVK
jgi:hypothetical protein